MRTKKRRFLPPPRPPHFPRKEKKLRGDHKFVATSLKLTADFASARGILWEDIENISGSTFEKFVENTYLQHNMEATSFEFDMQTKVEELRNILS